MRQLTVDVNLLVYGSVAGSSPHPESNSLMRTLEGCDACGIVLDSEGLIYNQYRTRLRGHPYGLKWLRSVLASGRAVYVDRAMVSPRIRTELAETGFVGEDFGYYVRTCASSCCRVLTTYDRDFSHVARLLWQRLGIRLRGPTEGENFARDGPCGKCDVSPA